MPDESDLKPVELTSVKVEAEKEPKKKRKMNYASLKRILSLARPDLPLLALATLALLLATGGNLLLPAFAGFVIGDLAGPVSAAQSEAVLSRIRLNSLLLLAILAVSAMLSFARKVLYTIVGERIVVRLRKLVFAAVIDMDVEFFDIRRTGELTNRLSSDCTTLSNTASVNVSMFLRFSIQTMAGLAILMSISWKLTLVMLSCVPFVAVGASVLGRFVRRISREAQDALAHAGEAAEESFSAIRTVKAFTGEQQESEKYGSAIDTYFEIAKRRAYMMASFSSGVSLAGGGCMSAVLYYGAVLVVDGEISSGLLVSYVLYTITIFAGFAMVAALYADLMKAMGASERVFELLSQPKSINQRGGSALETSEATTIEFKGISFAYPSRPDVTVLQHVDLTVERGNVVAIVGPSGSGKSTLASLLMRLYDADTGSILINGVDVRDLDPLSLRRHIGQVQQEPVLFACSIEDNIKYGKPDLSSNDDIVDAARDANALAFIESFPDGFDTLVGERGVQLSGGQKQRTCIARALLINPSILLLDEATSALDSESEYQVQEALDRLMVGRTTLLIAHRLSTVRRADKVVVLDCGKIVEMGTHDELVANGGVYKNLIEKQLFT